MRFFNFFTRCDGLYKALLAVDAVSGAVLWMSFFFSLGDLRLNGGNIGGAELLFAVGIAFWLMLVIVTVALRVLVKDAREDMNVLLRLMEEKNKEDDPK